MDKNKIFKNRFQKVPFVRKMLLSFYKNKCALCGKEINGDFVAHHINYTHCCKSEDVHMVEVPSKTRKHSKRILPDCEKCYYETPSEFMECLGYLIPIHKGCFLRTLDINKKM